VNTSQQPTNHLFARFFYGFSSQGDASLDKFGTALQDVDTSFSMQDPSGICPFLPALNSSLRLNEIKTSDWPILPPYAWYVAEPREPARPFPSRNAKDRGSLYRESYGQESRNPG